jgi:hypothetical protein
MIFGDAGNMPHAENPPYTEADFFAFYPQFQYVMPREALNEFLLLAQASINIGRWGEAWKVATGLFTAHFCTLYLQSSADPDADSTASAIGAAGQARGMIASKSVDGVSVSYDVSALNQDLNGFAAFKTTIYGIQLATMAKIAGLGGMVVR